MPSPILVAWSARLLAALLLLGVPMVSSAVTLDVTAPPYNAVCNGTANDTAAIQAAINALPAAGGTVTFPTGRLCGVGSVGLLVTQRSAVILQGTGSGSGLIVLAPGPAFVGFGPTTLQLVACYRCAVTRLTIDGSGLVNNLLGVQQCEDTRVTDNTLSRSGGNGAVVTASNRRNLYERNIIHTLTNAARGLWVGNTSPAEVEDHPTIVENTITAGGGSAITGTSNGAVIARNTLLGVGNTQGAGIALGSAAAARFQNAFITDNTITGFQYHSLQSDAIASGDYTQNIRVTNNRLQQSNGAGIFVVRARDWTITGNTILDQNMDAVGTGAGIYIDDAQRIWVEGNYIADTRSGAARTTSGGIGVVAQGYAGSVKDITLTGNTVVNIFGDGIQLTDVTPGTMDRVLIERNLSSDNAGWGIAVKDSVDGTITHVVATQNTCTRNVSGTIRMDPSDGIIN
jgi:parallel beta-helix repeat protein